MTACGEERTGPTGVRWVCIEEAGPPPDPPTRQSDPPRPFPSVLRSVVYSRWPGLAEDVPDPTPQHRHHFVSEHEARRRGIP